MRKNLSVKLGTIALILSAAISLSYFVERVFAQAGTDLNGMELLKKAIKDFNSREYGETFSGRAYRGGEGCLLLDPLTARSMGLKSIVTDNYTKGKGLFEEAERFLSLGIETMNSAGPEPFPEELLKLLHDFSCSHSRALIGGAEQMQAYRTAVSKEQDQRFDKEACESLLERLLVDCAEKNLGNLRDSLGCFYNRTRGMENGASPPLNTKNILFVNKIFAQYAQSVHKGLILSVLDLDRQDSPQVITGRWERAKAAIANPFVPILDRVFKKNLKAGLVVDPLLFLALMRQESNFNSSAISHVGAAGLTQIMPSTAKSLGMKNIFMPAYYDEARSFFTKETETRREAISLFRRICDTDWRVTAGAAVRKMRQSNESKAKRLELYGRYKSELLSGKADDRLDPEKAISQGFAYFGGILKEQGGDMSLALAGYNAGPHRVSQYEGLPPFAETITFRNNVMRFYREYLAASVR